MRNIAFIFLVIISFMQSTTAANAVDKERCTAKPESIEELSSWYYEVTVKIDTPNGVKSGSAVWHEFWQQDSTKHFGVVHKHEREAIPIVISDSQVIFAILKGSHGKNRLPFVSVRALPCELPKSDNYKPDLDKFISNYVGHKQSVHPMNYPDIVRFNDIDDPESMEIIYANSNKISEPPLDRFNEIFGEGFYLREITIEIVQKPVSWNLQNYISWIESPSVSNFNLYRQEFKERKQHDK